MSRPSKKALVQRIQDLITGVYGGRFSGEEYTAVFHMGDAKDFCKFVAVVNQSFPECTKFKGNGDWLMACMPWNLDEWGTPEELAVFLWNHWGDK